MLLLWEHPCGCWWESSEGKTDGPSTLNKLPPHWTPAFLMPGTDRELARQIWKAVCLLREVRKPSAFIKGLNSDWISMKTSSSNSRWQMGRLTASLYLLCYVLFYPVALRPVHCMFDKLDLICLCHRKSDIPQLLVPSVVKLLYIAVSESHDAACSLHYRDETISCFRYWVL